MFVPLRLDARRELRAKVPETGKAKDEAAARREGTPENVLSRLKARFRAAPRVPGPSFETVAPSLEECHPPSRSIGGAVHPVPFLRCTAHPYRCTVKPKKNITVPWLASTPISSLWLWETGVLWNFSRRPRPPGPAAVPASWPSGRATLPQKVRLRSGAAVRRVHSPGGRGGAPSGSSRPHPR